MRAPGLAATLVLTIALGAGINSALFGFISGIVSIDLTQADPRVTDRFNRVALLLAGASALVFALAAATVVSLLLARARARAQEMATRVALGASDLALLRLCLADVALVGVAGGAAGAIVGWWTVYLFPLLLWAPDAESLVLAPRVSWMAIASLGWIGVLVVAGTFPAFAEARRAPNEILRREAAGVAGGTSRRRERLVTAEVAIACLLLIVASAIREDLRSTLRTVKGEALGSLLVVPLAAHAVPTLQDGLAAYIREIEASIHDVPGLSGWAFATALPGGWPTTATFAVDLVAARTREVRFDVATFDAKATSAAGAAPVAGRQFGFEDAPGGPRVAIINDVAAAKYFDDDAVGRVLEARGGRLVEIVGVVPGSGDEGTAQPQLFYYAEQAFLPEPQIDEPFHVAPGGRRPRIALDRLAVSEGYAALFGEPPAEGRTIRAGDVEGAARVAVVSEDAGVDGEPIGAALISEDGRRFEVVGVVRADPLAAAQRALVPSVRLSLRQAAVPTILLPTGSIAGAVYLAVRTTEPPERARSALDWAVGSAPGGQALGVAITLEEHLVRTSLAGERIASALLGVVALVAMVIAVVGVTGALADFVSRRRRELAVRLALGASAGRLVWLVMAAGFRIVGAGFATAAVLAAIVVPVLGQLIAGPRLPDPITAVLATLATLGLVLLATGLPAWRATRIRPREVLG